MCQYLLFNDSGVEKKVVKKNIGEWYIILQEESASQRQACLKTDTSLEIHCNLIFTMPYCWSVYKAAFAVKTQNSILVYYNNAFIWIKQQIVCTCLCFWIEVSLFHLCCFCSLLASICFRRILEHLLWFLIMKVNTNIIALLYTRLIGTIS